MQASREGAKAVNHLVNANKKVVSKTPRTDRQAYITTGFQQYVKAGFARQLERQLRGANGRVLELELDVKSYKVRLIEDGERIYTLGTRSDNYRAALLKARERIKKLEAKMDELNDLKKWLEGR
jgi:phospholipase/lecithinase/hemolysin